jgi:hypothetical protein
MQLVTPDTLLRQYGELCAAAYCGVVSNAAATSADEAISVLIGAPPLAIDLPMGAQRMILRIVPMEPNLSSHAQYGNNVQLEPWISAEEGGQVCARKFISTWDRK